MTKAELKKMEKLQELAGELGIELKSPDSSKAKGPELVSGKADSNIKLKVEGNNLQLTTDLTKAYEKAKNGKTLFVAKTEHREWVPLMDKGKNSGYAFQVVVVYNPEKDER